MFKRYLYKVAYYIRGLYWLVTQPITQGVKVILKHQGQILMIRNTYGRRWWTFPGGGLHRSESYEAAALREVKEEVGIEIGQLERIGEITLQRWYRNHVVVFETELLGPEFRIAPAEIAEARWFGSDNLPAYLSPTARKVLDIHPSLNRPT